MIYWIIRNFILVIFYLIFRVKIEGLENVPKEGAVIVCSNHMSYLDPVLVGITINRQIHYMAKKELFDSKVLGWFLRHLAVFPVNRGTADMESFKTAIKLLKSGEVMGIFAQGTRVKDIDAKAAKAGVAMFALKTGSCVVPVGISGVYSPIRRITIKYGKPISLDEYAGVKIKPDLLHEITEGIMEKVSELTH